MCRGHALSEFALFYQDDSYIAKLPRALVTLSILIVSVTGNLSEKCKVKIYFMFSRHNSKRFYVTRWSN